MKCSIYVHYQTAQHGDSHQQFDSYYSNRTKSILQMLHYLPVFFEVFERTQLRRAHRRCESDEAPQLWRRLSELHRVGVRVWRVRSSWGRLQSQTLREGSFHSAKQPPVNPCNLNCPLEQVGVNFGLGQTSQETQVHQCECNLEATGGTLRLR